MDAQTNITKAMMPTLLRACSRLKMNLPICSSSFSSRGNDVLNGVVDVIDVFIEEKLIEEKRTHRDDQREQGNQRKENVIGKSGGALLRLDIGKSDRM